MPDDARSRLGAQVAELRQRALDELAAVSDYYVATKAAWRLLWQYAEAGRAFRVRNPSTGNDFTLDELATRSREYTRRQLAEATFQQSLATFEAYLSDLLTVWLTAYPESVRGRQFEFQLLLDAANRTDAVGRVIAAEVGAVMYKSLEEQFRYLTSRTGIEPPPPPRLAALQEAKATRNVLVHNRGVVNSQYLSLAGRSARFQPGERVEIPEPYRREVWELVRQLVTDLSAAALTKLPPPAPPG